MRSTAQFSRSEVLSFHLTVPKGGIPQDYTHQEQKASRHEGPLSEHPSPRRAAVRPRLVRLLRHPDPRGPQADPEHHDVHHEVSDGPKRELPPARLAQQDHEQVGPEQRTQEASRRNARPVVEVQEGPKESQREPEGVGAEPSPASLFFVLQRGVKGRVPDANHSREAHHGDLHEVGGGYSQGEFLPAVVRVALRAGVAVEANPQRQRFFWSGHHAACGSCCCRAGVPAGGRVVCRLGCNEVESDRALRSFKDALGVRVCVQQEEREAQFKKPHYVGPVVRESCSGTCRGNPTNFRHSWR